MRKLKFLAIVMVLAACETVDPGHKGVEVSWGGETNLQMVYSEGMDSGLHWIFDGMVQYDVREKTLVQKFTFNDKNNMSTGVELALDYNLNPEQVNKLHTQINDVETKIMKTLKSAGKEVVPQYSASELNLSKRTDAEQKLSDILERELPEFYVQFARVQLTDVDIPKPIADAAEATAKQLELNKLALEKAQEAENNYKAAEWDAKTKAKLSEPQMLKLLQVENEKMMWQGFLRHGKSPYGSNNVFGAGSNVGVFKGLQ